MKLKSFGAHCLKVYIWRRILQPEYRLSYGKHVQMTVKTVHNLLFNAQALQCILLDAQALHCILLDARVLRYTFVHIFIYFSMSLLT